MTNKPAAIKSEFITPLTEPHLENPGYAPAVLLDAVTDHFSLKNDAALSRALGLPPPVISKLRMKAVAITPAILLRIHDVTGFSISDMRAMLGVKPSVELRAQAQ
jgi:plasmid maintenance system antidote protein VapI